MRRLFAAALASIAVLLAGSAPALACAGLIGSNGAVNLGRTTTLAAYHEGVEHYITAFQFQGGGGQFGTLIPLPGVPSSVEKGGAWTLQRLVRETEPQKFFLDTALAARSAGPVPAEVLLEKRIDALDITVLKGGSRAVADWATDHGFRLSPDAPEMLEFYAKRSPIFLAAIFDGDAAAARGQQLGDGTPVHITIPTPTPWVPLRILGLGKQPGDLIDADVYLLTDRAPALLPRPHRGLDLLHSAAATDLLLSDLRSDEGMSWIPESAWLTKLRIDSTAGELRYDLAIDASGQGTPSRVAAGLDLPLATQADPTVLPPAWALIALAAALLAFPISMSLVKARR
ncbi:MAG: DUF2330 domain-containing protein [Dehalococcoidia bacterium]